MPIRGIPGISSWVPVRFINKCPLFTDIHRSSIDHKPSIIGHLCTFYGGQWWSQGWSNGWPTGGGTGGWPGGWSPCTPPVPVRGCTGMVRTLGTPRSGRPRVSRWCHGGQHTVRTTPRPAEHKQRPASHATCEATTWDMRRRTDTNDNVRRVTPAREASTVHGLHVVYRTDPWITVVYRCALASYAP